MESSTITVLCFLSAVVLLIADYFIAAEFSQIAEMKGYSERKYFWFTFLFGIAGMLMVVALPLKDNKTTQYRETEPKNQYRETEPKNKQKYRCEKCGYEGYYGLNCPKCGSTLKRIVYDQTE